MTLDTYLTKELPGASTVNHINLQHSARQRRLASISSGQRSARPSPKSSCKSPNPTFDNTHAIREFEAEAMNSASSQRRSPSLSIEHELRELRKELLEDAHLSKRLRAILNDVNGETSTHEVDPAHEITKETTIPATVASPITNSASSAITTSRLGPGSDQENCLLPVGSSIMRKSRKESRRDGTLTPHFAILSANPHQSGPLVYLKPLPYDIVALRPAGGNNIHPPRSEFAGCPGNSIEESRALKIINYRTNCRVMFYVEFEKLAMDGRPYSSWIDLDIMLELEPKYLLVDFIRTLYLYHRKAWTALNIKAKSVHCRDLKVRFISEQIEQIWNIDSYERGKEKRIKWYYKQRK